LTMSKEEKEECTKQNELTKKGYSRTGNWYLFSESGINFLCVIQNDWKTANFAELYFPHFTTFRNETS
jgi:hypothetical protein